VGSGSIPRGGGGGVLRTNWVLRFEIDVTLAIHPPGREISKLRGYALQIWRPALLWGCFWLFWVFLVLGFFVVGGEGIGEESRGSKEQSDV